MKKNQLTTIILLVILIIVSILGMMILDNTKSVYKEPSIEKNTFVENKEETIEEYDVPSKNDLVQKDYKEEYILNDPTLYSIKDKIKLINIPYDTLYYIENSQIFVKNGYVYNFEFIIDSYNFNPDTHTLDFEVSMYSLDLEATKDIMKSNFKLMYENEELELVSNMDFTINKNLTKFKLSYKIDEEKTLNDLNIAFFNLKYVDDFNERNIKLY